MITVDTNRVNHVAEIESSASEGAGLVELWDGVGQVMWHHAGVCGLSTTSGQFGAEQARNACANGVIAPTTKRGRSGAT
jgi:hypothetical protein